MVPALQSSFINVNEALKEGTGGSATGSHGLRKLSARSLLVVGAVALSLSLLTGAGLMIKSLLRLQSVNLGFAPENVLMMTVYSRDAKPEFYERLLARVQGTPGVERQGETVDGLVVRPSQSAGPVLRRIVANAIRS